MTHSSAPHLSTFERIKGSLDSRHYLEWDKLAGLNALQRRHAKHGVKSAWVFVNAFGRMGIARMRRPSCRFKHTFTHATSQHRLAPRASPKKATLRFSIRRNAR
jgi:hypothetical protein